MTIKKIYKNSSENRPVPTPTEDKKVITLENRVRQLSELINKQQSEIDRLNKTIRRQKSDINDLFRNQSRS